jgi:Xaa-Pro aminopeptidase
MPFKEYQHLEKGLAQGEVIEADDILSSLRSMKSPKEIDQIRRAARIVNLGFDLLGRTPFSNPGELALEAQIDRDMRLEGVEDVRTLFATPDQPKWALRPAADLTLSEGDRIIIYLALSYERYWADGLRTLTFTNGHFVDATPDGFRDLCQKSLTGIKPQMTATQVTQKIASDVRAGGFAPIADYGIGQGVGLALHESPYFDDQDQTVLQAGMCFALRLALNDPQAGAIMGGDTYLLNENGPEKLTV